MEVGTGNGDAKKGLPEPAQRRQNEPIKIEPDKAVQIYGAVIQLATHGQENMWWMIYIFLTFNSILLLSCAALFSSQEYTYSHKILLSVVFPLAGIITDYCWLLMAGNYADASRIYSASAIVVENSFPEGIPKPLFNREEKRNSRNQIGSNEMRSVAQIIPVIFIVIYVIVMVFGWVFVQIKEVKNKIDTATFVDSVGTAEKRLDGANDAMRTMLATEIAATHDELRRLHDVIENLLLRSNKTQDVAIADLERRVRQMEQTRGSSASPNKSRK